MSAATVLVLDDEENIRTVLSIILGRQGHKVITAASAGEALMLLDEQRVDLVLSDIRLPGMDGIAFLKSLRERYLHLPVIMMTAFGTIENAIEAMRAGATDYLPKPLKAEEIALRVGRALGEVRLREENERLRVEVEQRYSFHSLIGKSAAMRAVYRQIEKIAPHKTPVLITGESGTGKELIARAIHYNSPRRDGPLICINCAAIAPTLIESELFGHARGAFTDAFHDKIGLFEAASGGTLFLDELGEIPLALQAKLLRVLTEHEVVRVGETRPRKIDTRVVAATVRKLREEIRKGTFREDLYYRVSVVPIALPPLRERREDIPLLVRHFLQKICRANKMPQKVLSQDAMDLLLQHEWPGNVRQLENAIERAVVMSEGDVITPEALALDNTTPGRHLSVFVPEDLFDLKRAQKEAVESVEKTMIRRALRREGDNRTRAARLLGISHRALMYKIKQYGLESLGGRAAGGGGRSAARRGGREGG